MAWLSETSEGRAKMRSRLAEKLEDWGIPRLGEYERGEWVVRLQRRQGDVGDLASSRVRTEQRISVA